MVAINGDAAVVGGLGGPEGFSRYVYVYYQGAWILSNTFEIGRYEHAAVMVPDSALTGCSK